MTVLVVGGTGVIGRRLVATLSERGIDCVATTRHPEAAPAIPGVRWCCLDLARATDWDELLGGIDAVFLLAWSTIPASSRLDPASDVSENVVGCIRMLEAARRQPGIRVVFTSSGGTVYGPVDRLPIDEAHPNKPISSYGISKLVVEHYIEHYRAEYGLDGVALRLANCYGSGQQTHRGLGAVTLFARAALKGEPLTIFGDGEIVRDFIHVDDVVSALLAAADRRYVPGPFNIGSGVGHSLNDIVKILQAALEMPIETKYVEQRPFDVAASVLCIRKAQAQLDWAPKLSLEAGIKQIVAELSIELSDRCASPSSYTATSQSTSTEPRLTREASHSN